MPWLPAVPLAQGHEPSTEAAQSSSPVAQDVTLNVAALKGPTGIGMVKLMKDAKDGATANKYNFTLAGAPDEITAKFASGEFDIAAVPVNLAAALYNKTKGNAQVMAVNTLGVLYILETVIQSILFPISRAKRSMPPVRALRRNIS